MTGHQTLTVRKCCWSASGWRLAVPGTFHKSDAGWSSENPSLLGPHCQRAPAAERTDKNTLAQLSVHLTGLSEESAIQRFLLYLDFFILWSLLSFLIISGSLSAISCRKGAERQPLHLILFWLLDLLIMWCLCIVKNAVARRGSNTAAGRCSFLFWKCIFDHLDEGVSVLRRQTGTGPWITPSSILLLGYLFCMFLAWHKTQKWIWLKKIHRINQQQSSQIHLSGWQTQITHWPLHL